MSALHTEDNNNNYGWFWNFINEIKSNQCVTRSDFQYEMRMMEGNFNEKFDKVIGMIQDLKQEIQDIKESLACAV